MPEIPGLQYLPEYVDEGRERELTEIVDGQPWRTELKRRVQHYGYVYDYQARRVTREMFLGPLPDWLQDLARELNAQGWMSSPADQVIVNEYEPGQGIAAHVDCVPCFGDIVASLTLGSSCVMEFSHLRTRAKVPVFLEPRSLIVLSGEARYQWRHAIPARKSDDRDGKTIPRGRRLSLTFRTVLLT